MTDMEQTENVISSNADFIMYEGQRYGSIPVSLFLIDASMQAKCLYAYLWTYVNPRGVYTAYPGTARIAEELGVSERTIWTYTRELETVGALDKLYRAKVDPEWKGNPAARIYMLKLPNIAGTFSQTLANTSSQTVARALSQTLSDEHTKETNKKNKRDVVVNSDEEQLKAYLEIAEANSKIKNKKGWARAMLERGVPLEELRSKKKKQADTDYWVKLYQELNNEPVT